MKRIVLIAFAALMLAPLSAFADNVRPVAINPIASCEGGPPAGQPDCSVQSILDFIYGEGVINASSGQRTTALWQLPTALPGSISPNLRFEYAGNAGSNTFGIYTGSTLLTIFNGAATSGCIATVSFSALGAATVFDTTPGAGGCGGGLGVNTAAVGVVGINPSAFGFTLNGTFFTQDAANPGGAPMALAYLGRGGTWTLAWEDLLNGDKDYNDMVVSVESVTPVPEPGTLVLLGTALLGLAGLARRRA